MRKFQIPTSPYDDERLYWRKEVKFYPRHITCLVGCNGSGKSTLMRLVKDQLKKDPDVLILSYDDRTEGGHHMMEALNFYGDMTGLAQMYMSSEGERIINGIEYFVGGMRKRIHDKNPKEVWIFMDAVGSGLSIDGILDVKDVAKCIIEDNKDRDVYFIISTNEFEFAKGSDCIDVTTFLHWYFNNYDTYQKFILKTRAKKNRRCKT